MRTLLLPLLLAALPCMAADINVGPGARYTTLQPALREAERLSATGDSVTVHIAPGVYWLDNPDDTTLVRPLPGDRTPYAMRLTMSNTRLTGTTGDPADVVLAVNRGQTQGADGNYTMFYIRGDNNSFEHLTMGNYCNVDLVYPRRPALGRKRRADAIVQAQLAIVSGTGYTARNCRFISRLNLCPLAGADSVRFTQCYFECTDDALAAGALYDRCRFTLYSSKPFYSTGRGATLRDCDVHCRTAGTQYLTKQSSPVRLIGCRFTSDDPALRLAWAPHPNPRHACLAEGCTLNGRPLLLPPTPDVPMPVAMPALEVRKPQGVWTLDAHCPTDLGIYSFEPDTTRAAWVYGEGVDGAEGCHGLIPNVRGARIMYAAEPVRPDIAQTLTVCLDPCKSGGQGFGSATGQYMDVCVKFDAATLTGYGVRLVRTAAHDHAVDTYLVRYDHGRITPLSPARTTTLFRRGCHLTLQWQAGTLTATLERDGDTLTQQAAAEANPYGGMMLQHTGSTGASATVVSLLHCSYSIGN